MCADRRAVTSGFSFVEMIVAMAIMLVLSAAIFELINPAYGMFAHPDLSDVQQRIRVASDAIFKDIVTAGSRPGGTFPPVLPFRTGARSPDPPGTFFDDRISVLYVPTSGAGTTLRVATEEGNIVLVNAQPGCPAGSPLCSFAANELAVICDESGAYDTFRILEVQPASLALVHEGRTLSKSYAPGTTVAPVVAATYWVQTDPSTGHGQLMKYDGDRTDLPVVDDVAALRFEYYGGAGRFDRAQLTDGPWLPDPAFTTRYDADLLLIRRIRITLQVRQQQPLLRAPLVDQEITFDVTPRNLGLRP
ncbi:MAG TPA: prepilin-type N-terminal cleavage/methylation domain-containing protein [Vicinamibacterales bacterium]|nr:prepilin-type N-terminal cleavage/methylation domain-containing protein [Vicinamibacterales bacterium]